MLSTAGSTGSIPGWETKISHAGYGIVGKKQKQTNTPTKKQISQQLFSIQEGVGLCQSDHNAALSHKT